MQYNTRTIQQYSIASHFFLLLASAGLMFVTLPGSINPFGSPIGAMFAFVPLFLVIRRVNSIRLLALLAVFFGIFANLLQFYWLSYFQSFAVWSLISVLLAYGVYHILYFIGLFAASRLRANCRPLAIAIIVSAYEYLKSVGVLGFPWGILANASSASLPLIQFADLCGVWGLSFLLAYANAVILELCLAACKGEIIAGDRPFLHWFRNTVSGRHLLLLISLLAIVYGYGFSRLAEHYTVQENISAILVQNNSDPWVRGQDESSLLENQRLSLEGIQQLQEKDNKPDIVIWSETALYMPYSSYEHVYSDYPKDYPLRSFLQDIETFVFTGSPIHKNITNGNMQKTIRMNGAILLASSGEVLGSYAKQHLVPYAEHIPDWNIPLLQNFYTNVVGISNFWTPGHESTLITLPLQGQGRKTLNIGTLICFEDSFGYLARRASLRGADLFINISNNSWSGSYGTLAQHIAAARFRSVETRKTLIRVGNNGITSIIDAWGRILSTARSLQQAVLVNTDIPVYNHYKTLYLQWGNYFGYIMVILTLYIALLFALQTRKKYIIRCS